MTTRIQRQKYQILKSWVDSPIRSPLVLIGPRQVGKTTLLHQLGTEIGKRLFVINFWSDHKNILKNIFTNSGSPKKILESLADYFDVDQIDIKNDVLFFDEIQECPDAYSSLKSFKEEVRDLKILVTGSYLQLFLKNEELKKLPVGCTDEFHLGPVSFEEFLQAANPELYKKFEAISILNLDISQILHEKFYNVWQEYLFVGGLPEVVSLYLQSDKSISSRNAVRKKQLDLIDQYTLDFQKYGKSIHVKKIDQIFQSIPLQLERVGDESVQRFSFNALGKNVKYQSLHWSFGFLKNTGLIIKSFLVSKIDQPFIVHEQKEDRNLFKCFYFDIGLLNAALNSSPRIRLEELGSYKGYIAENMVAISITNFIHKELITYKKSSKSDSAEIEFLVHSSDYGIIPIEVKSSKKSLRSKSLDFFVESFSPKLAFKLVPNLTIVSEADIVAKKGYYQIPIYMVDKVIRTII